MKERDLGSQSRTFCGPDECEVPMEEEDILEAMRDIPGYLDITPGDFKELYKLACRHAVRRFLQRVKVREIMTREVLTVPAEMPLWEVAQSMAARGVSGVPVVERSGKVVGVISEKDFLRVMGAKEYPNFMAVIARCLKEKGCVVAPIQQSTAGDIMSRPPVVVSEDAPVVEVVRILRERTINRVPVVDSEGKIVGIVSRGDILKAPFLRGQL
jgi:CBS domain-containing protein